MRIAAINESGYKKIWCPVCKTDKPKAPVAYAGMLSWVSQPDPVNLANITLVGSYAMCAECHAKFESLGTHRKREMCNEAERELLKKYPALYRKLPPGFTPGN